MTWLPVAIDGAERDSVLGLKPEPYEAIRRVLTTAWRITDPHLLDLCRLRLAQLAGARAELAGADASVLAELADWESGTGLDERTRATLHFAEQYHYDHQLLGNGAREALERFLSRRELVNFVWALHMNYAYVRMLSLLDIAPDPEGFPARVERTAPDRNQPAATPAAAGEPAEGAMSSLMDAEFHAAYSELNPIVVRQSLVDEMTSEAVRLRNASYQGCFY